MLAVAVGDAVWLLGPPDLLHSFFSTISWHLEPGGWGSRFPSLMNVLYQGEVSHELAERAAAELGVARRGLSTRPGTDVVWDFDDPMQVPPWGTAVERGVPDLSCCFFTSDGRNLFDVLASALHALATDASVVLRVTEATATV